VIKTIGNKKYAYQAYRNGNRVTHRYLGSVSDQNVSAKISELKMEKQIPQQLYPLFWDAAPGKINLRTNARYIVERVLEMGNLEAFQWIQKLYPTRLIMETCGTSRKISEKSKTFWKIWLGTHNAF
jgi:hypothetical protein